MITLIILLDLEHFFHVHVGGIVCGDEAYGRISEARGGAYIKLPV